MELRRLRYFVVTAEEQHVARAAERLGIAQPALSQQLKVLEQSLGVRLFERVGRGIRLSEVGAQFLPAARDTLAQAERAMQVAEAAARGALGNIEIGYVGSAMLEDQLPALLHDFRQHHPGVLLGLRRLPVEEQLILLDQRALDLACVRGSVLDAWPALRAHALSSTPMLLALPARHRLAGQARIALAALAEDDFLVLQDGSREGHLAIQTRTLCAAAGFTPRIAIRVGELVSLVGLVAAGMGVSLVPASAAKIAGAQVVFRPLEGGGSNLDLMLLWHRDNHSAALSRLLGLARVAAPA